VTGEARFGRVHRQDIAGERWTTTGAREQRELSNSVTRSSRYLCGGRAIIPRSGVSCPPHTGWSSVTARSNYQLVGPPGWTNDTSTLTPHPDYYTSILWRQLMSSTALAVLNVTGPADAVGNVSLHVWCAAAGGTGASSGAVVLAYGNPTPVNVTLASIALQDGGSGGAAEPPSIEDLSAATDAGTPPTFLTNDAIYLNGALLTVGEDGSLPVYPIPGRPVGSGGGGAGLLLPTYSYGFFVLPDAAVPACSR
jgi:hypothetical protein